MFRSIGRKLRDLFGRKVDEEMLQDLEKLFYEADLGSKTSLELADKVRAFYKKSKDPSLQDILNEIESVLTAQLQMPDTAVVSSSSPHVILIVGVNGNGKTTTVAKLSHYYQRAGKSVLVGAADTFRAAAADQLERWVSRIDVPLIRGKANSDPAAVVFDTLEAAKSRSSDIVLIDTAGRLHNKTDLMRELEKIRRVSDKVVPGAPHETLLVIDATTGQNALEQAQQFNKYTPLSGLVLTKIDSSSRGGTAISIQSDLKLPIKFLGVGEKIEDLQNFDSKTFVSSLLEGAFS